MVTRRRLLELSARIAAAGFALRAPAFAGRAHGIAYGVQMFEVRATALKELAAAFRMIKDAGFDNVELYPIAYRIPASELKNLLSDTGLTSVSGHFDYAARPTSIEYAHTLGLQYIVCPWIDEPQRTIDGFHQAAAHFNGWGEEARKAGMTFVFHNHCYEFKPLGNEHHDGWSILMQGTDPWLVKLEFDLFWLTTAGQDPMEFLKKYSDRAVLVHLKDRVAGAPTSYVPDAKATSYCTELGKGTIDWPALLRQAGHQGIRYAFLDQDDTKIPVAESMKISHAYLQSLNL